MANAADTLNRAYELIETGNVGSARNLLDTIRTQESDNPDFWWVYAHAVEDKVEGIDALDRLKALDPDYPGIAMLYREMELALPPGITRSAVSREQDNQLGSLPKPGEKGKASRRSLILALSLLSIVVVGGIVAGVFLLNRQPTTQTPTSAANTPSVVIVPESTSEVAVVEATVASVEPGIADIVAQSGVTTAGIRTQTTTLGNTLVLSICALPGPATSNAIASIVTTLSSQGFEPSLDILALAFASTDCTTNTETAMIGARIEIYRQFASGSLSSSQFLQNQIRLN